MNRMSFVFCTIILSGLTNACGPAQNDPGPGGVTVGEAKALDEAAEMLDERRTQLNETDQSDAARTE